MPRRGDDDFGPGPGYQVAVPRLTPAVKWMLVAMAALLVVELIDFNWLPRSLNVAPHLTGNHNPYLVGDG